MDPPKVVTFVTLNLKRVSAGAAAGGNTGRLVRARMEV